MFIQKLRTATGECHKKLEQNHLSIALMSVDVTDQIYTQYLVKLYPFVTGFEQYVFPQLQDYLQDIEERKKAGFIEDDLCQFGINVEDIEKINNQFFIQRYTGWNVCARRFYSWRPNNSKTFTDSFRFWF